MVGDFFGIDPRAASHAIGLGGLRIDSEASARSKAPGPSAIYVRGRVEGKGQLIEFILSLPHVLDKAISFTSDS